MKHREFNWAPPPVRLAYNNTHKVVCPGVEKLPRTEYDIHVVEYDKRFAETTELVPA